LKTANIGYWIGSEFRNYGYTKSAFSQMLKIAEEMGIIKVSCKILKGNSASLNIWKKYHAEISEDENAYYPVIKLKEVK
jgi:RimJ/RimL family protein N-acetyltransferase